MTADNLFDCQINGKRAGRGDDWSRLYSRNVTALIKPGANVLTVAAVNTTDTPNPAGLIGLLSITYADGHVQQIPTDKSWQVAMTARPARWPEAMELGSLGMAPWGNLNVTSDPTPDIDILARWLAKMGVQPDFDCVGGLSEHGLRYIHRSGDGTDIYFVANKNSHGEDAVCSFRVQGRQPELWWPDTGSIERIAQYQETATAPAFRSISSPRGRFLSSFARRKRRTPVKSRPFNAMARPPR